MKSELKLLPLALLAFASYPASAQVLVETNPQNGSSIEIGVGGMKNGPDELDPDARAQDMQFLIRVSGSALTKVHPRGDGESDYYIVARVRGDASVEGSSVAFLDVEFDPFVLGLNSVSTSGFRSIEAIFGKTDLERNIAINSGENLTIDVIGLAGGFNGKVSDTVKLGMNAALDLFSITTMQRYSDGAGGTGVGLGGTLEATAEIANRFRIVLGAKDTEMSSGFHTVDAGGDCSYYDSYTEEYVYSSCTYTVTDQLHDLAKFYVSFEANLTKNFKVFGVAQYAVYSVDSDTGAVDKSNEGRFQFRFGGSVRVP